MPPWGANSAEVLTRLTQTPCPIARARISCQRLQARHGARSRGMSPAWWRRGAATVTAGCNGTRVRPDDQLADLAIPQGLDHLLRPGSNGAALRDAALQLVQDAPLLRRLCRDEDGPDLCVDLGVPLRPGVRRLVDDPVRQTLRQQRSELLQDLAMAQQNHPQVGMLVPRLLHPPGQLLVEMEDVVLAVPLDGRLLFPPALARRVLLLRDELIDRVQES